MKLSSLLERADIACPPSAAELDITEIVTDSRKASEGCLFVCIAGSRSDGHSFIGEAIRKGAKVIVAEQVRDVGVGGAAAVYVENTRRAAALLYNSWYSDPARDMKLVGVTGTNGKTSVVNLLKRIFEKRGIVCGTIGTLGCYVGEEKLDTLSDDPLSNMTTPEPAQLYKTLALMRERRVEYVFMEVSSHSLSLERVAALDFELAVFTNLTQDHLDFHNDMESYFLSKAKLFRKCRRALINLDGDYAERLIGCAECDGIYTVSLNKKADYYVEDVEYLSFGGVRYSMIDSINKEKTEMSIGLSGSFAVINSLDAAAAARLCGIPRETVADALSQVSGIDGRMELVELGEDADISVYIDYAHTPDALENLLCSIRSFRQKDQRIVLLFGCGGDRDRSTRRYMANIASRMADLVIITSDNSRSESPDIIFSDILRGIDKEKEYLLIPDRQEAIEYAVCNSYPRDIIVLAGKGHERYEIDAKGRRPFDEREITKKAYLKYKALNDGQ